MSVLNIGNTAVPRALILQTLEQDHAFLRDRLALLDAKGSLTHHLRHSYNQALESRQAMIDWLQRSPHPVS